MQHLYGNNPNQGSNYIKDTHGINMITRVGETYLRPLWARLWHQWGPLGDEAPPQKSVLRYATYKQAMTYFRTLLFVVIKYTYLPPTYTNFI
jgi:hypothetical protein